MEYTRDQSSFSEFEWFLPAPKKVELKITIPNNNCFNLNQKLTEKIYKKIVIGVSEDGKTLALKEDISKGYNVPKSGIIKAFNLITAIKARGIRLPACYTLQKEDDYWIATLIPPVNSPSPPKKTPKKPRANGLSIMLPTGRHA